MKLAIVSPCFNEEEIIETSVERLIKLLEELISEELISEESFILLVNDGSSDRTWSLISRLYSENHLLRAINLGQNVGHQNAIMAGMMVAKDQCDGVITIDIDLQDDLNAIREMLEAYRKGYDIVYGVKKCRKADPFMKRLSAMAFYGLQNSMGIKCIYNHADFRFMSRKALYELSLYNERNLYLRGIIPILGLPSTMVSDNIKDRIGGKSKYTFSRMMRLAADGITSFSIKPIHFIILIGSVFIAVSFIIAIYVVASLILDLAMHGWASLMLSIWFVGGVIMISLGIIGIYIGKIYTEVKQRPLYNIKEKLL